MVWPVIRRDLFRTSWEQLRKQHNYIVWSLFWNVLVNTSSGQEVFCEVADLLRLSTVEYISVITKESADKIPKYHSKASGYQWVQYTKQPYRSYSWKFAVVAAFCSTKTWWNGIIWYYCWIYMVCGEKNVCRFTVLLYGYMIEAFTLNLVIYKDGETKILFL